ncbi:hypothetical protein LB572_27895 [Mesorhizobium sp. BH1-1-5]|uniref:hypothetical protein n=1 Tax=Mesorhizobium sp. BH1-1-5 TaxID=2876661 RepID=UPI001CC9244D|nr:hypothetical protein [Mesorhizobium sp. BH1-1-5]MBZ9990932.1 hypothetical protein [Mesorhizobium sp. BH1-1-5]
MALEDDIEMVKGHVRLGEWHLVRQHELIAQLTRDDLPAAQAIDFLHQLEDMQELHRKHLARLQRKAADNELFTSQRAALDPEAAGHSADASN